MAKKKRSTVNAVDEIESFTLREVFENPDGDADSKGWLLVAARCAAQDARVDIKTFITRAVDHFWDQHRHELAANRDAYRIPTEEEDEESNRISRAIGYMDPRPERNPFSQGFRPDIALGGSGFNENQRDE